MIVRFGATRTLLLSPGTSLPIRFARGWFTRRVTIRCGMQFGFSEIARRDGLLQVLLVVSEEFSSAQEIGTLIDYVFGHDQAGVVYR